LRIADWKMQAAEAGSTNGEFPPPDFDGLPLDRYLAPDLVLPLITAHGCYHGRCAFCNVGYGTGQGFHALPVEQVLKQINALRAKHGVRHLPRMKPSPATCVPSPRNSLNKASVGGAAVRGSRALSEPLLNSMAAGAAGCCSSA
jgi:hypothetical protein